jgi:hypothetical protein
MTCLRSVGMFKLLALDTLTSAAGAGRQPEPGELRDAGIEMLLAVGS